MRKKSVEWAIAFIGNATQKPRGKKSPQVIPSQKIKGREYKIKWDSRQRFSNGRIISEDVYNSVKENYDIRIKSWIGDSLHIGKEVFYISGPKRELIKDFLVKRKYNVTENKYHYFVTGNGKNVAWMSMESEIQEMGNVKSIYIQVIGESGYDRAPLV